MKKVSILALVLALVVSMIPQALSDPDWSWGDEKCLHTGRKILKSERTNVVVQNGGPNSHTRKYREYYQCIVEEGCHEKFWDTRWEPEPHTWGNWVLVETPSRYTRGKKRHTCLLCGQSATEPCY